MDLNRRYHYSFIVLMEPFQGLEEIQIIKSYRDLRMP